MYHIDSKVIKTYIEPHLHTALNQDRYLVKELDACQLLTYKRLDIAFKLFYLARLDNNIHFSKEMYIEHIRAFSLGEFTEPGNSNKNSIAKFIKSFYETFMDIKKYGFDSSKTLIPMTTDHTVINGAHRVASAIFLHKKVACVEIPIDTPYYDYSFFYQRNMPIAMLEQAVNTFVEYANNVHIAFIWPIAKSNDTQIDTLIPNVVYKKEITFTPNGAHNLLSQIYYGEEWLGTVENNFSGSKGKLVECFKSFEPVKVIVFQANNLDEVLTIKEKVRETFNVGKHSIHITDTQEEALRTVRIVLNENSIHFLNYAKPNCFLSTHQKIDTFKNFLNVNKVNEADIIIDSSMILSVYGLREAKDIDYLSATGIEIKEEVTMVHAHDEVLDYYEKDKNELIYNPKYYFYFNDIKFMAFDTVYKMKQNRAEIKDITDCNIMKGLIEDNRIKRWIHAYKQKLFYVQVLIRQKIITILHKVGLFDSTYALYKKMKQ